RPMRLIAVTLVSFAQAASAVAQGDQSGRKTARGTPMPTFDGVRSVSPALARYTQGPLLGDVWKRPGLSPRDRSIVTLAALIARNQTAEMPYYLNIALDNGVKPSEVSEIITHLAFYAGWANAMS